MWWFLISALGFGVQGYEEEGIIQSYPNAIDGSIGYEGLMCIPQESSLSGIEWILWKRREDYGWGEDTHRAIITLVLNDFGNLQREGMEVQLMKYQLEVELTKALLRNNTQPMHLSDLALYIHALLATNRDPRNFYGIDLVEILKARIYTASASSHANFFATLALCNCRALEQKHLQPILHVIMNPATTRNDRELQAVLLKTLACAADEIEFNGYSSHVRSKASSLALTQKGDGSFGNVYTTALIMQALIAAGHSDDWDEQKAREFLLTKRKGSVNMVSIYYTEMALNAHKIRFLKDLTNPSDPSSFAGFPTLPDLQKRPLAYFIQYSLRVGEHPNVYHTITIKVPENITFFDIMRLSAHEDTKFNFSWNMDPENNPAIYKISGIPNFAEESNYWQLIYETDIDHIRHTSKLELITKSPALLIPEENSHIIYWHRNAFKKLSNVKYP